MVRITATLDIAAPSTAVWRELIDWASYPDWNPMLRAIAGKPRVGAKINVSVASPVGTVQIPAVVMRLVVNSGITWHSKLPLSGLFDRDHIIEITPTPEGSRITQTQTFGGALARPASVFATGTVRAGLEAMNAALKARVEAATAAAADPVPPAAP